MNETEAAWLCGQVDPSYVIPMHYECIAGNTGNPGHFTTLIRESDTPATVLAPPRATPVTLALPCPQPHIPLQPHTTLQPHIPLPHPTPRCPPRPYCMVASFMQLLQHERGIHVVSPGTGGTRVAEVRYPSYPAGAKRFL